MLIESQFGYIAILTIYDIPCPCPCLFTESLYEILLFCQKRYPTSQVSFCRLGTWNWPEKHRQKQQNSTYSG